MISQTEKRNPFPFRPGPHGGQQCGTALGWKIHRRNDNVGRLLLQSANRLVEISGFSTR